MIEDVFDSYYDSYIDSLQDSVDVYYTCSECGKECLVIVEDDSFGYDYGSIKSSNIFVHTFSIFQIKIKQSEDC